MKKSAITIRMMMEMCMCRMRMLCCALFSDAISASDAKYCAA